MRTFIKPWMQATTLLLALLGAATSAAAAEAGEARDSPARIIADAQRLARPGAIERTDVVTIGGIEQVINIRGHDRDNPIMLVLHGGPGFPLLPVAHQYLRPWEEFFTVVQWDQRGAGKTHARNDPEAVRASMTIERMAADAEELAAHLRREFDRERIFVLAHSWGTVPGTLLALKRPEWLHAYVGIGQVVDFQRSEQLAYDSLLAQARADGDAEAVRELEALAPYPADPATTPIDMQLAALETQRKWLRRAGGYLWSRPDDRYFGIAGLSPDYSAADLQAFEQGIGFSMRALWPQLHGFNFNEVTRFECPMVIMMGRHDTNTSATLAKQWFDQWQAPSKHFVWFENSAHMVFEEEPGRLLLHLVQDVLPLAGSEGRAGERAVR